MKDSLFARVLRYEAENKSKGRIRSMKEYHKIENIFVRDTEDKNKLLEGVYENDTARYLRDCRWVWTEKIDGTNIRVHWDGHSVEIRGRTDRADLPVPLQTRLAELFEGENNEEIFEHNFGEKEVTLYGEGFGKGIQKVGAQYLSDRVDFVLFDVEIGGVWLKRGAVGSIASVFGVRSVPVVGVGTLSEAVDFVRVPHKTELVGDAPMEGIVVRPEEGVLDRLGHRVIVKIKARDFLGAPTTGLYGR